MNSKSVVHPVRDQEVYDYLHFFFKCQLVSLIFNEINANNHEVILIALLSLLFFNETATLIDLKETISRRFKKLSSPTLFLAVDRFTINIWFLSRGKKVIFRKRRLESNRTEEDPVPALL